MSAEAAAPLTETQLPPQFWERLLPYQREGVQRAVGVPFNGRLIIGDEMGLGRW